MNSEYERKREKRHTDRKIEHGKGRSFSNGEIPGWVPFSVYVKEEEAFCNSTTKIKLNLMP